MRPLLAALLLAATSALANGVAHATPPEPLRLAQAATPTPRAELIDINRASAQELTKLHGIGEVRAAAIVKGRPYARKDELVKKGIIPESVYEQIKEQIIARQ